LLVGSHIQYCTDFFDASILGGFYYLPTQVLPLLPRLEALSLSRIGTAFDVDALNAMVQWRWWTEEQLQFFALLAPLKVVRLLSVSIDSQEEGAGRRLGAKLDRLQMKYELQV
jgi:hypothetical protein